MTTGQRFTDNNNGTVTDTRTGLLWLKKANPCGKKTWNNSVLYCHSLASGTAGLTDASTAGQWRLPTKEELEGIGTDPPVTWKYGLPSVIWKMPRAPFTEVQTFLYWSGTSDVSNPNGAWVMIMYNGSKSTSNKNSITYVWPVRDSN